MQNTTTQDNIATAQSMRDCKKCVQTHLSHVLSFALGSALLPLGQVARLKAEYYKRN
jgi:hypothetical protein